MTAVDDLVRDYLARFDRAAAHLPPPLRSELRADMAAHLDEIRATIDGEAAMRQALDRLGAPEEIVAEAAADLPPPGAPTSRRGRALDVTAVVLLLVGGLLLPGIGWVVGVVLLWSSPSWTTGERLLGTLVVPGGLLAPVLLGLLPARTAPLPPPVGMSLLVVLVVAPIAVAALLLRRAESRRSGT